MRVIGTAGHVDHGKSTLVEKLSGIQPDRLAEEQARKMTIDLGFAWLGLPSGETVGIVDVPGHRDFIENMLAGVGGIAAALLVVAADEGIMPQTREHLAILRLLDIQRICVVLSKVDLIDDPEWLELVTLEVEDLLAAHRYDSAPILPVSAHTGAGLPALKAELQRLLAQLPPPSAGGQPRLPVDRVFVISGFGTVLTGTLMGGALEVGDAVELQPRGLRGRIRGLQSYQRELKRVEAGSRVAVNVTGISSADARRGDVLSKPGLLPPTLLADAHFSQLGDVARRLKHNAEVKVFCGAAESVARVRLLETEALPPGADGWLQLRLRDALPLARGDRYILRYPSPAETIGGGIIVNPYPGRRHKRFRRDVIADLQLRLRGSPAERLAQAAASDSPQKPAALQRSLGFADAEMAAATEEAISAGLLRRCEDGALIAASTWEKLAGKVEAELRAYHQRQPLRLGLRLAELSSRLGLAANILESIIANEDRFVAESRLLRLREHEIIFSAQQRASIEKLMQTLEQQPYTPPTIGEMNQMAGEAVVRALLDQRRLVKVSDAIAFSAAAYDALVAAVRQHLRAHDEIDAKTLRDAFDTTRKYAIPVLEHLDSLGITQRVGDIRRGGRNL